MSGRHTVYPRRHLAAALLTVPPPFPLPPLRRSALLPSPTAVLLPRRCPPTLGACCCCCRPYRPAAAMSPPPVPSEGLLHGAAALISDLDGTVRFPGGGGGRWGDGGRLAFWLPACYSAHRFLSCGSLTLERSRDRRTDWGAGWGVGSITQHLCTGWLSHMRWWGSPACPFCLFLCVGGLCGILFAVRCPPHGAAF